jgi:uncharacterized membrane protein YraQ (UPF0718 family)
VKPKRRQLVQGAIVCGFVVFVGVSFTAEISLGQAMGKTFTTTLLQMLKLLPCAFVLTALFDVWIKRRTVEKHFGSGSGVRGYLWGILLGGMTIGGLYLSFPLAYSLFRKGAKLSVVLAYVGFAGVCRIPMTMFELAFMGPTFTAVRLGVSIPLIIATSIVMGRILERCDYQIRE